MPPALVYIDRSRILPGKREEVRDRIEGLTRFVRENVPRAITYDVYFGPEPDQMTVIHVHPDAASLQEHMERSGSRFAPFKELLRLESIDVYGTPGRTVSEMLEKKADMLGGATLTVHEPVSGFERSHVAH